ALAYLDGSAGGHRGRRERDGSAGWHRGRRERRYGPVLCFQASEENGEFYVRFGFEADGVNRRGCVAVDLSQIRLGEHLPGTNLQRLPLRFDLKVDRDFLANGYLFALA